MNEPADASWYVVAVLIPAVGIVLGIVQLARGFVGPGLALVLTGTLATAVWIAVLGAL